MVNWQCEDSGGRGAGQVARSRDQRRSESEEEMNWAERIARAEKEGRFTNEDSLMSRDWFTCAVGEKVFFRQTECSWSSLPVAVHSILGSKAHRLGHRFHNSVGKDNISRAKQIYEEIQRLKV